MRDNGALQDHLITRQKNSIHPNPTISIGLPVYNAENYLAEAIESILQQDFEDFELIISDNGSTDGTRAICESYVQQDSRIRYFRHEQNRGAAWNFNYTFSQSRGDFFKWAAHDDRLRPEFLGRCMSILEDRPDASVAFCKASVIDETGRHVCEYEDDHDKFDSDDPLIRFDYAVYGDHQFISVFGLMRKACLEKTDLIGHFGSADVVLLGQLALLGKIVKCKDRLFEWRNHDQQSMRRVFGEGDNHAYTLWFDPRRKGKPSFPHWKLLFGYLRSVLCAKLSLLQKCKGVLIILRRRERISGRRQYLLDFVYAFKCMFYRRR